MSLQTNPGVYGAMKFNNHFYQSLRKYFMPAVLPILLAVIPTLYYYGNNVEKLTSVSLYRMLAFNSILAIVVYALCLLFTRFNGMKAAIAASIFLIFFNIYGVAYRYLLSLDVIRVKHYTLLPLTILLALYAMGFVARRKASVSKGLWKGILPVVGILVLFNLINIVPAEIGRLRSNPPSTARQDPHVEASFNRNSPDIYYIVLDEFEGLQGMRDYWKYQGVDDFAEFLKARDFFVAEDSHGDTTNTLHEMASRLNYREYAHVEEDYKKYFDAIADNRVIEYLKSKGYTTVVFDETKLGYPAAESLQADYVYEYGSPSIPHRQVGKFTFFFDEFGQLVIDNTMLYAISQEYRSNIELINNHTNMISFTINNIASKKVSSPKFVYVHLLLPHIPFIYDENGGIVEHDHYTNWNYYIDNYKFSINVAEKMVEQILLEADPENPPVIILQSDHGARNYPVPRDPNSVILKNYPDDLKKLILNTFYLPGYDYSSLPQDIHPSNTFPIVFNYLFDAGIPLLK